jgi:neutral trehalase
MVKEIYKKYQDKWFLREVFDELLSWNRWWEKNRDVDGYLCWGSDIYDITSQNADLVRYVGEKQAAMWESGLDNSPMYYEASFDTTTHKLMLADVGLMSLYIADCQSLAEIATVLEETEAEKELIRRADKYKLKLETLWNDKFGLYLNKNLLTGEFSYRLSPTLFYPLIANVPDQKQARRMIDEHFYNPEEFFGKWIMPSISRNDEYFGRQDYWRGRIWAPMNFLVYLGLRNYDLPDARKIMVEKSANLLLQSWTAENYVCENYNAILGTWNDRENCDRFYHWGALLGYISLIENGYVLPPETKLKK